MSAVNVSPFFCARDSVILITLSRSCTRLYSTEYISNLPDSILLISSIELIISFIEAPALCMLDEYAVIFSSCESLKIISLKPRMALRGVLKS